MGSAGTVFTVLENCIVSSIETESLLQTHTLIFKADGKLEKLHNIDSWGTLNFGHVTCPANFKRADCKCVSMILIGLENYDKSKLI